jgi:hypothetical protein
MSQKIFETLKGLGLDCCKEMKPFLPYSELLK